ncbi:antitermination protein Q [Morganella morganii]|uniref:antitermination protein Q n=1 Tax=Morganella morganii TaxID=582 RepID=UPI003F516CFA
MAFEDYARSAGSVCQCQDCGGKGQLTHRCQCRGRGKVPDEEQTLLQGVPVIKDCLRCSGRGYRRVPSSVAYNAIVIHFQAQTDGQSQ